MCLRWRRERNEVAGTNLVLAITVINRRASRQDVDPLLLVQVGVKDERLFPRGDRDQVEPGTGETGWASEHRATHFGAFVPRVREGATRRLDLGGTEDVSGFAISVGHGCGL